MSVRLYLMSARTGIKRVEIYRCGMFNAHVRFAITRNVFTESFLMGNKHVLYFRWRPNRSLNYVLFRQVRCKFLSVSIS